MAGDEQPAGHPQTHLAQADKCDSGHPTPPFTGAQHSRTAP
jgi:hypothetical protein